MPRDLSDVLHYFLPETEPSSHRVEGAEPDGPGADARPAPGEWERLPIPPPHGTSDTPGAPVTAPKAALPIVAIPADDEDVVRAALLWNLSIEIARRGGRSLLLRPDRPAAGPAWPRAGRQPLGAELLLRPARDLGELYRAAVDLALLRATAGEHGVVLVQVPPEWLGAPGDGAALLKWTLLLTRSETADLRMTWRLARTLVAARPDARLGVTIHGATSRESAERGFGSLARAARARLGRDLSSYGLLVDDLHVYRALTHERPIGLTHPQSLAARALHDVAGILLDDARDLDLG